MEVAIPHQLGRDEARRRLRENNLSTINGIAGGVAQVKTAWPSEDRMTMDIAAMGQALVGHIDVGDAQVILHVDLPPALGFLEPIIEGAIRKQGQQLLEAPKGG